MLCKIINPSDPYTLETDNFEAAAVGICMVGNGKLGLQEIGGDGRATPVLFGWETWLEEHGIMLEHVGQGASWLSENGEAMIEALRSVRIGSAAERRAMLDAEKYITDPEKLKAYKAEQQDKARSSMNDIGTACWEYADAMEEQLRRNRKEEAHGQNTQS